MVLLHDLQSFGMFMRVGRSFVPSDLRAVLFSHEGCLCKLLPFKEYGFV